MSRRARPLFLVLFALALAGGCAAGNASSGGGTFASRDMLTREQLAESRATNAFDAVQQLRGRWLRPRGTSQMPGQNGGPQYQENAIVVYMDNQRLGTVETLRTVEIAAVEYLRFYSAAEASARWGFNHGNGAIYVSTRPLGQ